METETCPVCGGTAVCGGDSDHGERSRFSCPRCGKFEITGTALAMLESRRDGMAYARLSHSIRRQQGVGEEWFLVTSANIDELVSAPLPNIATQLGYLISWIGKGLGEDKLGTYPLPCLDNLAGVLGTLDGTRVERLLKHAEEQGLVNLSNDDETALTHKGWNMLEGLVAADQPDSKCGTAATQSNEVHQVQEPNVELAHCNQCGGDRNALVRARHSVPGNDGPVSWNTTMEILECAGCREISARRTFWFSEWETMDHDPLTGELVRHMPTEVTYWPAKQTRERPPWRERISDENLRQVMDEVYAAVDQDLVVLATIGARTLLDRAMLLQVGDKRKGFRGKLNAMVAAGFMGKEEKDKFEVMVDAGSAAAHRAHIPDRQTLDSVLAAAEGLLYRLFILPTEAQKVSAKTPERGQG